MEQQMTTTVTDDQKTAISAWIAEGAGPSEIQKRLKDQFGISLTYLETRLLADDLKVEFKDAEKRVDAPPLPKPSAPKEASPAAAGGKVNVAIDHITRPGALISGRVTFSDGQTADWALDQMGRLSLNPATANYRPTQQDIMDFQAELEKLARSQGF